MGSPNEYSISIVSKIRRTLEILVPCRAAVPQLVLLRWAQFKPAPEERKVFPPLPTCTFKTEILCYWQKHQQLVTATRCCNLSARRQVGSHSGRVGVFFFSLSEFDQDGGTMRGEPLMWFMASITVAAATKLSIVSPLRQREKNLLGSPTAWPLMHISVWAHIVHRWRGREGDH